MATQYAMTAILNGTTKVYWISTGSADMSGTLSGYNPANLTSIAVDYTTTLSTTGTNASSVNGDIFISQIGGRLTTVSATPITTTDQTSKSVVYYTPYISNRISLYDGYNWNNYATGEISITLSALTSGKNYDIFIYNNAGTLTLELSSAWASDSARTDAISRQDGVYVKTSTPTRRYLGTIRTTGITTTEDSLSKRYVWNYYNQVSRDLLVTEATVSWTYGTNTWRAANGNAANSFTYVNGDPGHKIKTIVHGLAQGSGVGYVSGVGVDVTNANSAQLRGGAPGSGLYTPVPAEYTGYPGLGFHTITWLEIAFSGTNVTAYGTAGNASNQAGMMAEILG